MSDGPYDYAREIHDAEPYATSRTDGPTAEDGMSDEAYADLVRRRGW